MTHPEGRAPSREQNDPDDTRTPRAILLAAACLLCVLAAAGLAVSLLTPQGPPTNPAGAADVAIGTASLRIDVNSAPASELDLLPRIGPTLSARIVEDRASRGPFRRVEDLDRVRGIGPKTVELLRPHVEFGPSGGGRENADD